jgi:uncharacterized metal-binding protein
MSFVVWPMPVLYACAGCAEFGYAAPRVARALDERGLVEAIWLGRARLRVTGRYPILSLDACEKRCAREWVCERGGTVALALVLDPLERDAPEVAIARIAARLRRVRT